MDDIPQLFWGLFWQIRHRLAAVNLRALIRLLENINVTTILSAFRRHLKIP